MKGKPSPAYVFMNAYYRTFVKSVLDPMSIADIRKSRWMKVFSQGAWYIEAMVRVNIINKCTAEVVGQFISKCLQEYMSLINEC